MHSHFRAYFETANANAGPDCNLEFLWPGTELKPHCSHRFGDYFRDNATPASVNCGHTACSWIHNEDWQTVGRPNRDGHSWLLGDDRVAWAKLARLRSHQNLIGVNLLGGCHVAGLQPSRAHPSAETVLQPGKWLKPVNAIYVGIVKPEQY